MIIKDGKLIKVTEEDIDENGHLIIPSEVRFIDEEALSGLQKLKSVEISEGVEGLSPYAFNALPNLEKVKFPNSMKKIGSSDVVAPFSNTPKLSDIEVSPTVPFTKNCFGRDLTQKIVEQRLTMVEQILANPKATEEEIKYALEIYDSVIFHRAFFKSDKEIQDRFNNITAQVIKRLKTKDTDGKELGQKLISEKFENNELITPSLLNYDTYNLYESLGIEDEFKPIEFEFCQQVALMGVDNVLTFGYDQMKRVFKKKTGEDVSSNNDLSLFMMWVIRHEVMHLYQKTRDPNSKDIEDRKLFLISQMQSSEDGYDKGHSSRHIASHDCFPDEIDADVKAISLLAQGALIDYNYSKYPKEEYKQKAEARERRAREEIGIGEDEDIALSVMEKALASDRLSDSEREKLTKIADKYKELVDEEVKE